MLTRKIMISCSVLCVFLLVSVGQSATEGLWLLNEGSGTAIGDSSGNGHNGSITWNGSWSTDSPFEPDPANNSLGATKEVRIPDASGLDPAGEFTIETWVKFGGLGGNPFLVSKRGLGALSTTGYFLEFYSGNTFAFTTGNGSSFSGTSGTIGAGAYSALTMQTDVWYHIAGVHTATENILYINGISNGGNGAGVVAGNPDDLTIGFYGAGDKYGDFANDDVRLSDVALSSNELGFHNALPEPGTICLLGMGAVSLFRRRRSRS